VSPVHFCLCIPKTVKDTAIRFWNIVKDSERYLSPYKVLSHLYRKSQHGGVETGHFRKSAKSRMPDSKSPDYKQQTFSLTTFIFSWAPENVKNLCCWHSFLTSIFAGNAICLTNILPKWTEIYGLKMWHRNVRRSSRT